MMLGNLLLFCLLLLQISAVPAPEPEPNVNIMIDIDVDGESISGGANSNGGCGKGYRRVGYQCEWDGEWWINQDQVTCGIEGPSASRIINGVNVISARKYSWQVGLSLNNKPNYDVYCGGSIITNKHILTAAHCWDIASPNYVGIGSNKKDDTSIVIQIAEEYIHKDYNKKTKDNDIAIVKLSQPIDLLNNDISPICIPRNDDYDYTGTSATVSGWGSTVGYNPIPTPHPKPENPNILQEAQVPVISNTVCKQIGYPLTERMLCAGDMKGFENDGKDSCQGDSGGPLTLQEKGQYQQIGVVSFGAGCASEGIPGVYTRVTKFLDWINDKVKPEKVYTAS